MQCKSIVKMGQANHRQIENAALREHIGQGRVILLSTGRHCSAIE
jgi:hypothetical protein